MAKDILKEAIADAKAVREVALANAKAALEEAFTPKLQNMLSAKLSEELDGDVDEMMYDEDESDLDEVHRPHYEADEVHLVNPKAEYVAENQEFDLDALLKEINDLEEEEITEDEITEKKDEEKAMDGSNKHAEEPVKKLLLLP